LPWILCASRMSFRILWDFAQAVQQTPTCEVPRHRGF
jgi:hypothetical protein